MDVSGLQESFGRAVMAGCLVVSAALALACLVQLARGVCRWSARTIRKVGVATCLVIGILAAWATVVGTPTREDKSDAASRLEGESETNRLMGAAMGVGTLPVGGVSTLGLVSSDADDGDGDAGPGAGDVQTSEGGAPGGRESVPAVRPLTDADYAAGFALARIGTGETWDFAPPPGAEVSDDWTRFGAARDWFRASWHVDDGAWGAGFPFPFGTNVLGALTVFSHGTARPDTADASTFISPLDADLGIVSAANGGLLAPDDRPSQFWRCLTPSNTFVMTWRNVLLGRDSASPVSFQAELFGNGDVVFRYDLSRLAADPVTNVVAGMSSGGAGRTFASLARSTTSLRWARLNPFWAGDPDPDGDGVPTADEIFVHFTDPGRADTDMDGLSDYDEVTVHRTDPLDPHALDPDVCDGIAVNLGGYDPRTCPPGSTNTVLEHVFYGGSPTAPVSRPLPTPGSSVLLVSASGTGSGELIVGGQVVPLLGSAQGAARTRALVAGRAASGSTPLAIAVPKGENIPVLLRSSGDLTLDLDSEEFAFGVLPDAAQGRLLGYVNFPVTEATPACIHDFNARHREVTLPVRSGAALLRCTWMGSGGVTAENVPPRSARITGNFSARSTAGASYTLSHPLHLFGRTTYAQEVRFCPRPPEPEDDEDTGDEEDPPWFEEGEGDPSDGDPPPEPESCCSQGICRGEDGCDCGCDCCLGDDEGVDGGGEDAETCPVHEVDYDTCAPLHAEAYTNAVQSVEPIRDVLLIRDPPQYRTVRLEVPSGHRNCCPCPEHWTNYVGVAYRSRGLRVLGEDGNDFRISERTCDVRVAGVGPSAAPGDAELAFARNGEICELRNYTVLGLEIRNGDASRPSLAEYNALSAALGYPLAVNTNVWHAPSLELVAKVRLPGGNVHLEFEGATGQFTLWYWDPVRGEHRRLLDTDTGGTLDLEYNRWRRMFGVRSSRAPVTAPVLVTSSSPGRVRLRFRYWAVVDGRFVEDEVSQVLTSVSPPLLPDINHDGSVNAGDVAGWLEGRRFHFWQNQERVKGGCVGEDHDDSPNASDLRVNGAYDLLNFFPLALQVEPFRGAWGTSVTYRLEPAWPEEGMFNFCVARVPRDSVADFQKSATTTIAGAPLSSTSLLALPAGGVSLPGATVEALSSGGCMIVAEAPKPYVGLRLSILRGGKTLFSFTAPLHISPVREMYRLVELRGAVSDPNFSPAVQTRSPDGYPDEETDGTHFVFAHGYNVDGAEALVWHDQMFKRLWWAGSRSMYSGVVWNGSESQVQLPYAGGVTPDYYVNVGHAFATAPHLATAVQRLPGSRKYLAAHSLGNMLVSSAIVDHDLRCDRYFMFNAAVALEAYDTSSITATTRHNMTPSSWRGYSDRVRASHWFELFSADDARHDLTWHGRFASLRNAVNYYSSEEDVLENSDGGVHTIAAAEYAWMNQETRKGVWPAVLPGNNEAGWSFNTAYKVPDPYSGQGLPVLVPCSPAQTGNISRESLMTIPFFGDFDDMSVCGTNLVESVPSRAQLLADAIPAESYAAGRNPVPGWGLGVASCENVDMVSLRKSGVTARWIHGFLKDSAFMHVADLFDDMLQKR